MKVGHMVTHNDMIGFVLRLDPFDDGLHTEILWFDEDEPGGTIISVWVNDDFKVIGTICNEGQE
jgi:hypothetical protein